MKVIKQINEKFILRNDDNSLMGEFGTQEELDLAVKKINALWTKVYVIRFEHGRVEASAAIFATYVAEVEGIWYQCSYGDHRNYRPAAKQVVFGGWFQTMREAADQLIEFFKTVG